jgi:hypothetical protein
MLKWKWGVIPVVLGCGVLGLIIRTFVHCYVSSIA